MAMATGMILALAMQAQAAAGPAAPPPPPSPRLLETAAAVAAYPNTRVTGYVVSGRTLRAVRAAMETQRPADTAGARHDALTFWRIQPRLMRRGGECDPQSADAEYTITVTLPDLESPEQLSRAERTKWDQYFAALVGHEMNHARIVQEGVERLKAAMRAETGCEAIQAASRSGMAAIREASAQYDERTRHGATEGALLIVPRR